MDSIEHGGPVAEVGEWVEEKLTLLRRYIEISGAARAKYVDRTEATYIDLYSGPGLGDGHADMHIIRLDNGLTLSAHDAASDAYNEWDALLRKLKLIR